jgi:hypothetical protein
MEIPLDEAFTIGLINNKNDNNHNTALDANFMDFPFPMSIL